MIRYVVGNLFDSEAEAFVNTVNCEGYMGKGIAYQFKLKFPENNRSYVNACRNGSLKIGSLHYFQEHNKMIINFPTKDKWRANSKMEYIEKGLEQLSLLIQRLEIQSIALPPLGTGNGGLIWADVKKVMEVKLKEVSSSVNIIVYEPSRNYAAIPKSEPKLSLSALVLMNIKKNLTQFSNIRLQKTAYFMDRIYRLDYFHFQKYNFGPYDHSIDIVSKKIREFQEYHQVDTQKAYEIVLRKEISKKTEQQLAQMILPIMETTKMINRISSDKELEAMATIFFLLEEHHALNSEEILSYFRAWSNEKSSRFSDIEIEQGIQHLCHASMIEKNLFGTYQIQERGALERFERSSPDPTPDRVRRRLSSGW